MLISKIVSGGQPGVERGALEAACGLGFPCGGMIPKGLFSVDDAVPEWYRKMKVLPRKDRLFATERNIIESDATLVISRERFDERLCNGDRTGGARSAVCFCQQHLKPYLLLGSRSLGRTLEWLERRKKRGIVLNITGDLETISPVIQRTTFLFVEKLLRRVVSVDR